MSASALTLNVPVRRAKVICVMPDDSTPERPYIGIVSVLVDGEGASQTLTHGFWTRIVILPDGAHMAVFFVSGPAMITVVYDDYTIGAHNLDLGTQEGIDRQIAMARYAQDVADTTDFAALEQEEKERNWIRRSVSPGGLCQN